MKDEKRRRKGKREETTLDKLASFYLSNLSKMETDRIIILMVMICCRQSASECVLYHCKTNNISMEGTIAKMSCIILKSFSHQTA